jgi:hypothetical protein
MSSTFIYVTQDATKIHANCMLFEFHRVAFMNISTYFWWVHSWLGYTKGMSHLKIIIKSSLWMNTMFTTFVG